MKNIILTCCLLIVASGSKERPVKASAIQKKENGIKNGTKLTLDGKTYVYDDVAFAYGDPIASISYLDSRPSGNATSSQRYDRLQHP